jgi:uncharacterized phage protein (TIGR01671 family)
MSRELFFRAWDKVNKEMIDLGNMFCTITEGSHLGFACEDSFTHQYTHRPYTEFELMQYTGVRDKYSVCIFEGDIVKEKDRQGLERIEVIEYYENGFYYGNPMHDNWNAEQVEVIGNIYENPELLTTP